MRPDWGKAPSWANYAAQELSGTYYFHETEPRYQELTGEWVSKGQREIVPRVTVTPQQTLEARPASGPQFEKDCRQFQTYLDQMKAGNRHVFTE